MITGVSSWDCKCGLGVKAVTETDRANIENVQPLLVACPNCEEKQAIYTHRVVLVINEKKKEEDSAVV